MSAIDQLTQEFSRLPGVGTKTALRLVYHLMKGSSDDARRLAAAIREYESRIRHYFRFEVREIRPQRTPSISRRMFPTPSTP